jgi:arylsulfatase A-like enzyme
VRSEPSRHNVVVVVVDSLRPDHLGCYGYPRATSPHVDRIASDAIVFDRARAPSSWTWPSLASLLTGMPPPAHGVEDFDRCFLSDSLRTFPETLALAGCTTLGVTAHPMVSHTKNFQQGFEEWRELPLVSAARVAEQFRDWVRRYAGYQFFAFVHFYDPHRPWNPPEQFERRFTSDADATEMRHAVNTLRALRSAPVDPARAKGPIASEAEVAPNLSASAMVDLYDDEIAYVDEEIGRMWRALEDERLLDRTIFVVTSLHGEVLATKAPPSGGSLDPDLLDVPLIVRDPRERARRVGDVVDLTMLGPAVLRATGTDGSEGVRSPEGALDRSPWDPPLPRTTYAHTSLARLPGRAAPCELVELRTNDACFVAEVVTGGDGFTFAELFDGGSRPIAPAQRDLMLADLSRWYEDCRRRAVSRRFQRMDGVTESQLREFEK